MMSGPGGACILMTKDQLNQSILDSAPDAIAIVDQAGSIRYVNRQVSALFGYEPAQLIGQPVEVLLPERFRNRHVHHRRSFGSSMRVRPMGSGLDLYGRRRDGSEFPAEIGLSPVAAGEETLVAAAIRDVTDRKRIEAELVAAREAAERANKAKSRFLAAASHDLRQPLQTLSMLNGTLRRRLRNRAATEALEQQGRAITAMSRLLNSLLDISKLESGAVRPEVTDFHVAALFEELRAEFAALAESKGLELRVDSCDDCVHSDPSLVGQILKNLVANAIKYTREGWVQIRCLHDPAAVRIEVLDTGIGMAPEHVAHIFDEFYQIGVSPNTARDGYGLGLSIVDRLARLLDLRLEVQSQPGKGSRFSFALPPGASRIPATMDAGATVRRPARGARRVLLVEDDAAARDATSLLLRAEGYDVTAAGSLDEAVHKVRAMPAPPDLLMTDYHLGGNLTGMDVIDALGEAIGQPTPAVIVTGDTSSAMREIGREAHLRVVSKPVDPDHLLAIVGELARRRV